jgi:hemerythrin-like domain-containing protein
MPVPGEFDTQVGDMFAVHHALTGALDQADDLVGGATTPERVEIVASFYDNVLEFLHVHHQGEDELVYPILESRCASERGLLERIDDQHKLLYQPMDEAWAAIAAWRASADVADGQRVAEAIDRIDDVLRPHLAEEETQVLPIASKWISPEEWGQLPAHSLGTFRRDKPWLALGLVMESLTDDQRAAMAASMPPELTQLWENEWGPAFNSFIGDVRA